MRTTTEQRAFERLIVEDYSYIVRTHRHRDPRFQQMWTRYGIFGACRQLLLPLPNEGCHSGFTWCWENDCLDRTVEARALEARWRPLFSQVELDVAKKRMDRVARR
jgi:hypothetical protein